MSFYSRFLLYYLFIKIIVFTLSNNSKKKNVKRQKRKNIMLLLFYITFDLQFEKLNNSRINYIRLKEILQILKSFAKNNVFIEIDNFIYTFTKKLDTLKR